jgi:siderophore synthetase component
VLDEMMIPLVETWATVAQQRGILLEAHAQNVLLEVDRSLRPQRVVHRDFDVWIDPEARERAGLPVPFSGSVIGRDTIYPRAPHYSLVYDHFLGRELLDYVLATLVRFYDADEAGIRRRVADVFHRSFRNADELFPPSTYYFPSEILPGNEFRLESTGTPPAWR